MAKRPRWAEVFASDPYWSAEAMNARLKQLTEATKVIYASYEGKITDMVEVPDWAERRQAHNLAMLLEGAFPAKQHQIDATFKVEQLLPLSDQMDTLPVAKLIEIVAEPPRALAAGESEPDDG